LRLLTLACLLASIALVRTEAWARGGENASGDLPAWTLGRVRAEAEANRKRLRSIRVESESIGRVFSQDRHTRQTLVVRGRNRFFERTHLQQLAGFDGTNDPEWRKSYLTEDMLTTVWVIDRFCKMSREQVRSQVGDSVRYQLFMECTGWWPPGESSLPEDEPDWALCKALRNDGCRVQGDLEFVDKHRCVVVEVPDPDKIWLDVDRGCAVIRRERQWNGKPMVYENSGFAEIAPGIWLPGKLRRVIFRGPGPDVPTHREGEVLIDLTQTVSRMEVNSVPDEAFVFKPEPGTLMFDAEQRKKWQIPGGEEEVLDGVSLAASAFARLSDDRDWGSARTYVAMDLLLLLAGVPAWILLVRQHRRREPAMTN